jgi:hypothetical protein
VGLWVGAWWSSGPVSLQCRDLVGLWGGGPLGLCCGGLLGLCSRGLAGLRGGGPVKWRSSRPEEQWLRGPMECGLGRQ